MSVGRFGKNTCSHLQRESYWSYILYTFLFLISVAPSKIIRLEGPLSANGSGRVEVFYQNIWGTICNGEWDMYDANVTCRQLGYKYAVRVLPDDEVPDGSGQIWLDDVSCTGSEQNLTSCSHKGWGNHDCDHDGDAGVECSLTGKNIIVAHDNQNEIAVELVSL